MRDQLVAVKMFRLDAPPEQARQIADTLETLVSSLPRHNGLLSLVAAGVERDMPYLVMTHSDVPSLDTRLKPGVPLDPEEALGIVRVLADALDAAHARGIVHGSLHPRDIFVDEHGDCRVSGFGVGTALARVGLRAPVRRPYSPPERLTSTALEAAADRFALGALAFELLSGRRLVGTGRDAAARCTVQAPEADAEHLRTALAAMLAENPAHRPSTAAAFAQALAASLFPRGSRGVSSPTPQPRGRGRNGQTGKVAAAAGQTPPARPADAGDDAPSLDELELFARQGTLWETESRASARDEAPAPIVKPLAEPEDDPLALFPTAAEVAEQAGHQQQDAEAARASHAASQAPKPDAVSAPPVSAGLTSGVGDFDLEAPRPRITADVPDTTQLPAPPFLRLDQDEVDVEPLPGPSGPVFIDDEHAEEAQKQASDAGADGGDARVTSMSEPAYDAPASVRAAANAPIASAAKASSPATPTPSAAPSPTAPLTSSSPLTPSSSDTSGIRSSETPRNALREIAEAQTPPAVAPASASESTIGAPAASLPPAASLSAAASAASGSTSTSNEADTIDAEHDDRAPAETPSHSAAGDATLVGVPSSFATATSTAAADTAPGTSTGARAAAGASDTTVETSSGFRSHSGATSSSAMFGADIEPADTGNPLRLMALVLVIGLAVGGAAGYLVGKRSVWQNGDNILTVPETAPVAGAGTGAGSGSGSGTAADGAGAAAPAASNAGAPGSVSSGGRSGAPGTTAAAGAAAAGAAGAPGTGTRAGAASGAARPEATTGRLLVRSTPSRADVLIDGTRRGVTPLTLRNLALGSYVVRVTRSGYAPEAHRVTLSVGRPSETVTFDLARVGAAAPRPTERPARGAAAGASAPPAPADDRTTPAAAASKGMGELYILSRPVGARVIVDGRLVGVTPLLLQDVAPGARTIRLELEGHRPWTDTVQVTAGQRVRVAASLELGS